MKTITALMAMAALGVLGASASIAAPDGVRVELAPYQSAAYVQQGDGGRLHHSPLAQSAQACARVGEPCKTGTDEPGGLQVSFSKPCCPGSTCQLHQKQQTTPWWTYHYRCAN